MTCATRSYRGARDCDPDILVGRSAAPGSLTPVPADLDEGPCALQAVLFDMDGLLVDTEPLWFETEAEVMARLGAPWTKHDQERLLGGSMQGTVAYLLSKAAKPATPDEIANWMTSGMMPAPPPAASSSAPAPAR